MLHICYSSSMKLNGFVWSGHLPGQNGIHLHKCLLVFVSPCILVLLYLYMYLSDRGICPAWVAPMEGAPPRGVVCNWLCSSVCLYLYNLAFLFVFVFVLVRSGHLWGSDGSVEWGSPRGLSVSTTDFGEEELTSWILFLSKIVNIDSELVFCFTYLCEGVASYLGSLKT